MTIIGILVGLILWPLFFVRAVVDATRIAFTIRQYTRCKECKKATHKNDMIFDHCVTCATTHVEGMEDVTEEIRNQSDWLTLQNDEYTQRNFDVFLDQNGFLYLQDFSDADDIKLKVIGHDGISL